MITLTIDGQPIEVEEGTKLLEAVERRGVTLPTLCHHKALTPYGACRLCIVEVTAPGRAATVQAACSYPAMEGLDVRTGTDRIRNARKIVAELLLARCPGSEVIRRIAAEQGVHEPRIRWKNDDCVYCGLCVRMCAERMGRSAIGFTGRGPRKRLESPFGAYNESCWACGACEAVCPVGKKVRSLTSAATPSLIPNAYNYGLDGRAAMSLLYPQAVPNVPSIDAASCLHLTEGVCGVCEEVCGAKAIDYREEPRSVALEVGAIVLAPGFEPYDPVGKPELGYGRYPNVVTALQFERILSPSGPYAGSVRRPSDGAHARRIAFLQCVGSRDAERDYCSAVCCMYATKEAIVAKEHSKEELHCDIYFMDVRAYSKGFERYFEAAKALGIEYIRCRVPRIEEIEGSRNLLVRFVTEDDRKASREYDMVILSIGMVPPKDARALAGTFGVDLNRFGFCDVSPFDSVASSREGVFVAGPFSEPKDIPETVLQGSAAAAEVLALLHDVRGQFITPKVYPPEIDVAGQEPRVGVFVCHCGTNIAGVVNVADVAEYAATLPHVVHVEHNLYTCSNDTQHRIRDKILELGLNRIVVASCTPRTHEPLFQNTLREAGLNPYLFEMANIRDQCSWVHRDEPERATRKAKDLVRIAVAKVRLDRPLYPRPLEVVPRALVIGGGIAGMEASLALARQGFGVELVEKEPVLGGYMRRVRYLLAPEDPQERLANVIASVEANPNIRVHTNATLTGFKGSLGKFTSTIEIAGNGGPFEVRHGVVIVATGADSYTPTEYLYGVDDRVLLGEELEPRLAAGSFEGDSVAFIQCVGSRNEEHAYCSRTCCGDTLKHARKLKEVRPEAAVYVLYRDLCAYGFRESHYTQARKDGVVFLRFAGARPPRVAALDGRLSVLVHEETVGEAVELLVDRVVLANATVPREGNRALGQMLKVPLSEDGFFLEAHRKLRPIDFATDGIFLCGNAHSPLGINETVAQALGTAARASTILSKNEIDLEPMISHVLEDKCDGCAYCVDPCPFKAITLVEFQVDGQTKKRVEVDESLCKGCGTCMATCPKAAVYVCHFRPEQLSAEVRAALDRD
ncbi:MAG TPA: 2Fe-2S iron-sulfur cluster-binding protein [Thermoanaerobaculia bacterium]